MNRHIKTFVYCIQERSRDAAAPIKVGIAQDPRQRLANLQVGNPMRLALYGLIGPLTSIDAGLLENDLHITMSKYHICGEWFTGDAIHLFDAKQAEIGLDLTRVSLVAV